MPDHTNPSLSIVVPTHNRAPLLRRLLSSLGEQTTPQGEYEIVVINDGSADETTEALQTSQKDLRTLRWKSFARGRGPAAARNEGWKLAQAPLILFLDDDVEATPDLVEKHMRFHRSGGMDRRTGLLGRVDWHPDLERTRFMRWLDRSGLQFGYDTWLRSGPVEPAYAAFYTANLSIPRALLEVVGGFDERFPYPAYEDMELAWRLKDHGFRLEYRSDVLVFHTRTIDLKTFRSRMKRVAESAAVLAELQPDFPVDLSPARWKRRNPRANLLAGVIARVVQSDTLLDAYYKSEVASGFREGLREGRAALRSRNSMPRPPDDRA